MEDPPEIFSLAHATRCYATHEWRFIFSGCLGLPQEQSGALRSLQESPCCHVYTLYRTLHWYAIVMKQAFFCIGTQLSALLIVGGTCPFNPFSGDATYDAHRFVKPLVLKLEATTNRCICRSLTECGITAGQSLSACRCYVIDMVPF